MSRQGVILAGGNGTRLRPVTYLINKHLVPIINIPMILFPIETLKSFGITDIMIVTGGEAMGDFTEFLKDGSEYGVNITYKVQHGPGGIAEALQLAKDYITGNFITILGDNIFDNKQFEGIQLINKSTLFLKEVPDPERFGVYNPDTKKIVEKPKNPPSKLAVTGLYYYTPDVFNFNFPASERGEKEITDVNNALDFDVKILTGFWRDAGTPSSLKDCIDWYWANRP